MKIIWHTKSSKKISELQSKLDIEYQFRRELNLFLVHQNLFDEEHDDFSDWVFYYNLETGTFEVSSETPEPFFTKLNAIWSQFLSFYKDRNGA